MLLRVYRRNMFCTDRIVGIHITTSKLLKSSKYFVIFYSRELTTTCQCAKRIRVKSRHAEQLEKCYVGIGNTICMRLKSNPPTHSTHPPIALIALMVAFTAPPVLYAAVLTNIVPNRRSFGSFQEAFNYPYPESQQDDRIQIRHYDGTFAEVMLCTLNSRTKRCNNMAP